MSVKLQLEAEEKTFRITDGLSRICNWLFNHLLDVANGLKEDFKAAGTPDSAKTVYSKRGLRNLVPRLKKEFPFLNTVHSSPLKNAALRLSDATQAHQKSKKGKKQGPCRMAEISVMDGPVR